MKQKHWSLLLATSLPSDRVRRVVLPRVLVWVLCLAAATSFFGLCRTVWIAASYGYAKLGVHTEKRTNTALLAKIRFFDRLIDKEHERIAGLIEFENTVRLQFGMNRISDDVRMAGVGGKPDIDKMIFASLEYPAVLRADSIGEAINGLLRRLGLQDSTFSQVTRFVSAKYARWAQRPTIWPVHSIQPSRITSGFGYRVHPITGYNIFHEGIDIANDVWTEIIATAQGIVTFSGYRQYFGNSVVIDHHGSGYKTVFAHLQKAAVEEGEVVRRGQTIGYLGNSGRSTGPHLHYEIRKWGRAVNPLEMILPNDTVID